MRHSVRALAYVLVLCCFAALLACGDDPPIEESQTSDGLREVPSSDRPESPSPAPSEAGASPETSKVPPQPTLTFQKAKDFHGTIFDLQGCTQTVRLIRCEFLITNTGVDRSYRIRVGRETQIFDQRGHQFQSTRVKLADVDTNRYYADKYLITEIPTQMTLFFEGVPSSIEFIKVLNIRTTDGTVQLRDIRFLPADQALGSTT